MVTVCPSFFDETTPESVTCAPKLATGSDALSVTEGGGPWTRTTPLSVGRRPSWYRYVPAVLKVNAQLLPDSRMGEANAPVLETIWRFSPALFVHRTESPSLTVSDA